MCSLAYVASAVFRYETQYPFQIMCHSEIVVLYVLLTPALIVTTMHFKKSKYIISAVLRYETKYTIHVSCHSDNIVLHFLLTQTLVVTTVHHLQFLKN